MTKKLVLLSAIGAALFASSVQGAVKEGLFAEPAETIISHSGGCRKSSPAGQCCHAGSQPYHCH